MKMLKDCFDANRDWAARMRAADPDFFEKLRHQQQPDLLWIGCSDSRLPPDRIIARQPGEVFVHRNVGNVVVHTDMNCLSVLQYGIEVLGVHHVIVCGHYGCGGVRAAMLARPLGLIDNWLRHIQDARDRHLGFLNALPDDATRWRAMCEINVIEQVRNVARTTLVADAWKRGQPLVLHGWIYGLEDGRLHDLQTALKSGPELDQVIHHAVLAVQARYLNASESRL